MKILCKPCEFRHSYVLLAQFICYIINSWSKILEDCLCKLGSVSTSKKRGCRVLHTEISSFKAGYVLQIRQPDKA